MTGQEVVTLIVDEHLLFRKHKGYILLLLLDLATYEMGRAINVSKEGQKIEDVIVIGDSGE